jgi:uncharacterized protein with HEPN domain
MNAQDKVRLRHMLDAAQAAMSFVEGHTRNSLDRDQMFAFAIVRAIEIVGEAAARISPETQQAAPQIPWKSITGMRHKIVHDYFDIDYEVVWQTVTERLPDLIEELNKLL